MARTTPLARALAEDLGVDLSKVTGTGRAGRITRADVEAAAGRPEPHPPLGGPPTGRVAGPGEGDEPLSTTPAPTTVPPTSVPAPTPTPAPASTSVSAPASVPAPATIPLVHLTVAVDAEALLGLQDDLGGEVTLPDLVARACAMLLHTDPTLDAAFGGDALTVTHLNVDQLRPPIDPAAAAVVAFGAVLPDVVATDDGIGVRRRMRLTLSIDDTAVDGATGARFLGRLKTALEHPIQILA